MCKGTVKEKAQVLFDIILGPEKTKKSVSVEEKKSLFSSVLNVIPLVDGDESEEDQSISWNSARMKNAFKKLIFFAEIFPKKY